MPRELRVSRIAGRHRPALGPLGRDAVGGEQLASAGIPGDPEESMLVRGDRVSVPELAPARTGHGEPEASVGIGAHVVQSGPGRSVGLRGLLAQHAVLDDRASASALARRGPVDLDYQLRKRLRSRHERRKGNSAAQLELILELPPGVQLAVGIAAFFIEEAVDVSAILPEQPGIALYRDRRSQVQAAFSLRGV